MSYNFKGILKVFFWNFLGYKFVCPSECQLAIVKGAVVLGHNTYTKKEVLKRRAKMTYGVANDALYVPDSHDRSKSEVVRNKNSTFLLQ